ncbi:MAG: hypothetical protein KF900_00325 [Bacteroidetes bacterium]|nr:hypothetical protein [Bacteroidota bacterium]
MKTFLKYVIFIYAFAGTLACAQNETAKWYFGQYAALDFMTNPPTILNNSAMNVLEGCASIADAAGNLLFYTDGVTVWNQQHTIMANGTGLWGGSTPSQSSIIIKQPGSINLYYVFTLEGLIGSGGLSYSIVDMSLASGMGSVTIKNTSLYLGQCSEKLTATKHANGVDYWVMIHEYNTNNFRTYLLSSGGVNPAIISSVGVTYNDFFFGTMKFSSNGQKIGAAIYAPARTIELYDFNKSTGVVSNALTLATNVYAYGCEFSPDAMKFYSYNNGIVQWDLNAGSNQAILSSSTTISNMGDYSMQLAPNGKIYITSQNSQSIHVINNPNVTGSGCNFVAYGQWLGGSPHASSMGLPNIISQPCLTFTTGVGNITTCYGSNMGGASVLAVSGIQVRSLIHGQTAQTLTQRQVSIMFPLVRGV